MERDNILLGVLGVCGVLHVINLTFGILSFTYASEGGPFNNLSGDLTTEYLIQFAPENWVFLMWNIIIWIWMTFIFIYLGANIFRSHSAGKMYCNPPLVTTDIGILMSISFCMHLVWLFLWDNEQLVPTVVLLFCLTISNWAVLILFTIRLWNATPFLFHHSRIDLWLCRILVQNGFGAYATWTTLEFFMKLGVSLTNVYEEDPMEFDYGPIPSAISAILLNFLLAITFPLEMMLWEKYLRYLVSPLLVILWTVACIYARLDLFGHRDETVKIYSLILLVISCLLFIARNASMSIRHFRLPLVQYV